MLDDIVYGNPVQSDLEFLEIDYPLKKHIPNLIKFGFPKNSSKATREELNTLVDYIEDLKASPDIAKRYMQYDANIERFFAKLILEQNLGEKGIEIIDNLLDETKPLIIQLKQHFNRPRPFQMAAQYKLKLFPFKSYSANSPSYPCGHSIQAGLICHVLGNHFPDRYSYFVSVAQDIAYSRQYMGLTYPSSVDYSNLCVEEILEDREFKQRFNL